MAKFSPIWSPCSKGTWVNKDTFHVPFLSVFNLRFVDHRADDDDVVRVLDEAAAFAGSDDCPAADDSAAAVVFQTGPVAGENSDLKLLESFLQVHT